MLAAYRVRLALTDGRTVERNLSHRVGAGPLFQP